jgi:hypothetical protein
VQTHERRSPISKSTLTPEQQIPQRAAWFEAAKWFGNVTVAYGRGGNSRKTFYKWRERFAEARGDRPSEYDGHHIPSHRRPSRFPFAQ